MSYSMGQVIYVLSDKTQTVLPGIVREEIHHRSLDGETTSYKIAIGPQSKQRVLDLSSVDGEVFGSLDDIREVLIKRLTAFVDQLCDTTASRVGQWYGQPNNSGQRAPTGGSGQSGLLDPSDLLSQVSQPNSNTPGGLGGLDLSTREVVDPDGTIRKVTVNLQ